MNASSSLKATLFQKRSVGEAINLSFALVRTHFKHIIKALASIVLPVALLYIAVQYYYTHNLWTDVNSGTLTTGNAVFDVANITGMALLVNVLGGLVSILSILTIFSYYKIAQETDENPSTASVWIEVRKNLGYAILLSILYGLAVFLATVLFIIPGIYFAVRFSLVFTTLVMERKDMDSFSRSSELIKDAWWRSFGFMILLSIIGYLIILAFSIPLMIFGGASAFLALDDPQAVSESLQSDGFIIASAAINILAMVFFGIIFYTGIFAWYCNMVEEKDAVGVKIALQEASSTESTNLNQEGEY